MVTEGGRDDGGPSEAVDERARSEMVARCERNDDDSICEPGMDMTFTRMS